MRKANQPFCFIGSSELREILGQEADDEKRLVELLEEVPLGSIYYHTHTYFLRHSNVEQLYPNDFAQWVATEVRDHVLGERLAVIDPFELQGLESLRGRTHFSHRRSFVPHTNCAARDLRQTVPFQPVQNSGDTHRSGGVDIGRIS